MVPRALWTLVFFLVGAGCGGRAVLDGEHDPRFVGRWLVMAPLSGLYWDSVYRFDADGALHLEDVKSAGYEKAGATGFVTRGASDWLGTTGALRCQFGDHWSSEGPATLLIAGRCSDGRDRIIKLAFNEDASKNSEVPSGLGVSYKPGQGSGGRLVSVGGEPGWLHRMVWVKRRQP